MKEKQKILTIILKLQDILGNEYPEVQNIFNKLKVKKDVKHAIKSIKSINDIKNLMKLTRDDRILQTPEGRELLVYLLSIDEEWTMGIYNNIRASLETADINSVKIYAIILMNSWQKAIDNRKIIETCLENLIFHSLRTNRDINGRVKLGQNLLIFLECIHLQKNNTIKQIMCNNYYKFIWTYLEAPGSCVRCNTAEILFIAYPMYVTNEFRKNKNDLKSNIYLSKQHKAITNLLRDSNTIVLSVALKGIFQILEKFWTTVPIKIINEWLCLAVEYTKTSNIPEIRKSVIMGFKSLLKNSKSHSTLEKLIPKLLNSLFDPNIDVKLAVLDLFLEIENCTNIYISNAVSLEIIVHCLEMNSHTEVVNSLHKLLWIRISFAKIKGRILNEIIDAGQLNINLFRDFFLQSKDIICYESALEILDLLLPEIARLTESLTETEVNENSSVTELSVKVKKKICGNASSHFTKLDVNKLTSIHIFIDASALLYLVNMESLMKNLHQIYVKELNLKIVEKMQNILEKFQDSELSELAIIFLSLIPKKLIKNLEEYLEKFKKKLLQQNVSDNMILSIIHLLFKWEEVDDLLDLLPCLVKDDENLHLKLDSFVKSSSMDRALGLKILEIIIDNNFLCNFLPKYYEKFINLWENLHFIEDCIESRLENNNFPNLLPDNVLKSIFKHYLSLIPILNSDNFKSEIHFSRIIIWTQEKILPRISNLTDLEAIGLLINLLKFVLNTSNDMIIELKASPKLCSKIIILYTKCLMEKCGIIFVNSALVTVLVLMKFSLKIFKNDESEILKTLVPSLFVAVMVTITKYPVELVKTNTNNLKTLTNLIENIFPLLSQSLDLRIKYMTIIFNAAVFYHSKDLKNLLSNGQIFSQENILDQVFSFITEELMKIILCFDEFDDLCFNILDKTYFKYKVLDQLSLLMIIQRLIGQRKKSTMKNKKRMKTAVRSIKEQIDNSSEIIDFTSVHDKFISDSKKQILKEMLSS
ncbi:uncharacterized protein LOC127283098 [Leptopilina boulardi]|uniref:uncharacterized protein LOC127283098 n=1 Tax=Leptopilina boulardi TaxID=63433 RepID=UPI0021F5C651|nr:uncharacterized protein LOC127283098 [Leptopilina boulardi]